MLPICNQYVIYVVNWQESIKKKNIHENAPDM